MNNDFYKKCTFMKNPHESDLRGCFKVLVATIGDIYENLKKNTESRMDFVLWDHFKTKTVRNVYSANDRSWSVIHIPEGKLPIFASIGFIEFVDPSTKCVLVDISSQADPVSNNTLKHFRDYKQIMELVKDENDEK